jgi:hypothetical protein
VVLVDDLRQSADCGFEAEPSGFSGCDRWIAHHSVRERWLDVKADRGGSAREDIRGRSAVPQMDRRVYELDRGIGKRDELRPQVKLNRGLQLAGVELSPFGAAADLGERPARQLEPVDLQNRNLRVRIIV